MRFPCYSCGRPVEATLEDVEKHCHNIGELVMCVECKQEEDEALVESGLGDCILNIKAFPRRFDA